MNHETHVPTRTIYKELMPWIAPMPVWTPIGLSLDCYPSPLPMTIDQQRIEFEMKNQLAKFGITSKQDDKFSVKQEKYEPEWAW